MKKLLVALTVSIMFFGCMGGGGRSLTGAGDGDGAPKVNQDAICQDAIADMEDSFVATTIKGKVVKSFFAEAVEACDGLNIDYIAPIVSLFVQNAATIKYCETSVAIKSRISAALNDSVEKRFEEILTFYTTNNSQCVSTSYDDLDDFDNTNEVR